MTLHGERHRTAHVKQTLNPEYPENRATFDFRISRSNVGDLGPLTFVVRDKDPFHDDYIGEAEILIHRWFTYDEPSPAFEFDNSQNEVGSAYLAAEFFARSTEARFLAILDQHHIQSEAHLAPGHHSTEDWVCSCRPHIPTRLRRHFFRVSTVCGDD